MRLLVLGVQLLIPFVVLYTIGYYIPGFSALTIPWIVLLGAVIFLVELLLEWILGGYLNRLGRLSLNFLAAAVIIFILTLVIEGGNVPLGGAILAAAIIAGLTELAHVEKSKARRSQP